MLQDIRAAYQALRLAGDARRRDYIDPPPGGGPARGTSLAAAAAAAGRGSRPGSAAGMIVVTMLGGERLALPHRAGMAVQQLKELLQERSRFGVPRGRQRLLLGRRELKSLTREGAARTLGDYGVAAGDQLQARRNCLFT